jgi:hypothetical protein
VRDLQVKTPAPGFLAGSHPKVVRRHGQLAHTVSLRQRPAQTQAATRQQPQPAQTRTTGTFTQRDHPPDAMGFLYVFKAARWAARASRLGTARPYSRCAPARPASGARSAGAKSMRPWGRLTYRKFHRYGWDVPAPAAGLSGAGQNLSRPSVTAGQPQPSSCRVNVHAKTALTEPARTRRWQLSEAGTRVARALTLKCQKGRWVCYALGQIPVVAQR